MRPEPLFTPPPPAARSASAIPRAMRTVRPRRWMPPTHHEAQHGQWIGPQRRLPRIGHEGDDAARGTDRSSRGTDGSGRVPGHTSAYQPGRPHYRRPQPGHGEANARHAMALVERELRGFLADLVSLPLDVRYRRSGADAASAGGPEHGNASETAGSGPGARRVPRAADPDRRLL